MAIVIFLNQAKMCMNIVIKYMQIKVFCKPSDWQIKNYTISFFLAIPKNTYFKKLVF